MRLGIPERWTQYVALLAIVILPSCALVNPHVTWKRPEPPVTLDSAIKYANDGWDAYKEGVSAYTTLPNVMALTLIPLGAGTIGSGIGGAHPETIGYLALAGAGTFTLAQWFQNPLRQDVYIAGMNGITCAVEAVLPLKIDGEELRNAIAEMQTTAGEADGHAREVARLVAEIDSGGQTAQSKAAAESFESAKEIFVLAQQAFGDSIALMNLHNRAGELLSTKIKVIDSLVTKQLKSTQRDTESLRALIGGLAQTARTLAPVSGEAAKLLGAEGEPAGFVAHGRTDEGKTRRDEVEEQLDGKVEQMNNKVGQLSVQAVRLQSIVNSVVRYKPSETLKKCGVEEVELGFTLDPSTDITLPRGKNRRVSAVGGTDPYKGELNPQPAEGVTLSQPRGTDKTFTIAASADAPIATYDLRIEDALGKVQRTKILIVDPKAAGRAKLQGAANKLESGGESISEAGGLFSVARAKVSDDGRKIRVQLKIDKRPAGIPTETGLKTKVAGLVSLSADQIEVENYTEIKNAGVVTPIPPPTTGSATQPDTATTGTASAVDPQKLQEFAGAIQGQSIVSSGATIAVGTVSVDAASNTVTVVVAGVSGGTLTDSQIKAALLVKGDGLRRGVRAANIRLAR